jgi:hypothetical protein
MELEPNTSKLDENGASFDWNDNCDEDIDSHLLLTYTFGVTSVKSSLTFDVEGASNVTGEVVIV